MISNNNYYDYYILKQFLLYLNLFLHIIYIKNTFVKYLCRNSALESLLIMIETLEINLHRSKQIYEMNDKEVKEYKQKTKNIGKKKIVLNKVYICIFNNTIYTNVTFLHLKEQRIIEGKLEIGELKKQLDQSKEERKNKLEYDEMARNINKYPSRSQIQNYF